MFDQGRLRRRTILLLAASTVLLSACGYHTAGKAGRLPQSLRVMAVPVFVNQTQTYRIEASLTSAVIREFNTRTTYKIIHDTSPDADATLKGTITATQLAPMTYDSRTGRASSALVTVNMKVTLTARDGTVLYENPNYVFRDQYQVTRELSSFFEEEGPAIERISRDFARTLVSNVLEAF